MLCSNAEKSPERNHGIEKSVGLHDRCEMALVDKRGSDGHAVPFGQKADLARDLVLDLAADFPSPFDFHDARGPSGLEQQIDLDAFAALAFPGVFPERCRRRRSRF